MDIQQLYYMIEVAKYNNFTKAANALYVTQPTLSLQIAKLEEELNTTLLIRSTRNVRLTKAGEIFVNDAKDVIDVWESLMNTMGKYMLKRNNYLSIAMFPAVKFTSLMDYTSKYINDHPDIVTEIEMSSDSEILKNLQSGICDIAFIEDSYVPTIKPNVKTALGNLILYPVCDSSIGALLRKDDPITKKSIIKRSELAGYKIICKGNGNNNTFKRIKRIFMLDGIDIGQPLTFTNSLEMVAELLQTPNRFACTNSIIGKNIEKSFPNLKFISMSSNKNIVIYMAMRKEDADNKTICNYFNYIKRRINQDLNLK